MTRFIISFLILLAVGCGKPVENPKPDEAQQEKKAPAQDAAKAEPAPPKKVNELERPVDDLKWQAVRDGLVGEGVDEQKAAAEFDAKFKGKRVGWQGTVTGINNMGQSFQADLGMDFMVYVELAKPEPALELGNWVGFEATLGKFDLVPLDWAPKAVMANLFVGKLTDRSADNPIVAELKKKMEDSDPGVRAGAAEELGGTDPLFSQQVAPYLLQIVEEDKSDEVALAAGKALCALLPRAGAKQSMVSNYNLTEALVGRMAKAQTPQLEAALARTAAGLDGADLGYFAVAFTNAFQAATHPELIKTLAAILGNLDERNASFTGSDLIKKALHLDNADGRKAAAESLATRGEWKSEAMKAFEEAANSDDAKAAAAAKEGLAILQR